MPISAKSLAGGGGGGVEIGECVFLPTVESALLEISGMTFLKSGHIAVGEQPAYPDAYARFPNTDGSIGLKTLAQDGPTSLYMRIK